MDVSKQRSVASGIYKIYGRYACELGNQCRRVASLVVHTLSPSVTHANLAAIVGSAIALIFSFIGFRIVVFK